MPPPPTKPTLAPLNGIRGLAAQVVALGHIVRYFIVTISDIESGKYPPLLFNVNNLTAVSLFFVISGFTLVVVYDRERDGEDAEMKEPVFKGWKERKEFFVKRVARLAPIYYLSLLLGVAGFVVYGYAWEYYWIPSTLLALQSLTYYGNAWVGPLWSVSAFIPQYILFAFTLHPMRRHPPRTLIIIIISCFVLTALLSILWSIFLPGFMIFLHFFGIFRLPVFVTGMCFGFLAKKVTVPHPKIFAEIISLLLLLDLIIGAILTKVWQYNFLTQFLLYPLQGFWILCLSQYPAGEGVTSKVLMWDWIRFLGDTSYAYYCLHWPVLQWVCFMVAGDFWGVKAYVFEGLDAAYHFFHVSAIPLLIIVPLAVATVAHNVLEKPARKTITEKATKPSAVLEGPTSQAPADLRNEDLGLTKGTGTVAVDVRERKEAGKRDVEEA